MNKFALLAIALCTAMPSFSLADTNAVATGSTAAITPKTYPDSPTEDVQNCLDKSKVKKPPETFRSHKVDAKDLPLTCVNGDMSRFKKALQHQINNCTLKKSDTLNQQKFQFGCRMVSKQDYCVNTNTQMLQLANKFGDDYAGFMKKAATEFDWYQSNGRNADEVVDPKTKLKNPNYKPFKKGDFQFTGYYSPDGIDASQSKTDEYRYPLYKSPPNLVSFKDGQDHCGVNPVNYVPYGYCLKKGDMLIPVPTRKEIANGALPDDLIMGYLKDPVGVPFLQVEGSGILNMKMPDGTTKKISAKYDSQNGRLRYMLSGVMDCMGVDRTAYPKSEDGIRKFIADNPDKAFATQNYDQSYVFFKPGQVTPQSSMLGSDDIPVTGGVSLAVDPKVVPMGSVSLLNLPSGQGAADKCPMTSTGAIAQDTGGAINGAHGDRYMGEDKDSQSKANAANDPGQLFMAIPKDAGTPIDGCVESNPQAAPSP